MPRVLRKRKVRRPVYTAGQLEQLLYGQSLADAGFTHDGKIAARLRDPAKSEAMRLAWQDLGEDLLAAWERDGHAGKPFAWWVFEEGRLPPRENTGRA